MYRAFHCPVYSPMRPLLFASPSSSLPENTNVRGIIWTFPPNRKVIFRNSLKQIRSRKITTSRALSFNLDEASAWVLKVKDENDAILSILIFKEQPQIAWNLTYLLVLTCLSSTSLIASLRKVSDRCLAASASYCASFLFFCSKGFGVPPYCISPGNVPGCCAPTRRASKAEPSCARPQEPSSWIEKTFLR